jgi:hypothetical protein
LGRTAPSKGLAFIGASRESGRPQISNLRA